MKKSSKKWFKKAVEEKAPNTLGEWSKKSPAATRQKQAMDSRPSNWSDHKKYLSVARALQALSNVTTDAATKSVAKDDADYFFEKAKKSNKERKSNKKKAGGKAVDMDYEKNILPILEESVKAAWKPIAKKYGLYDEKVSEIENKSGDGFMAFTDGGYTAHAFTTLNDLDGTGINMPTEKSQKQIDTWIQECYDEASEKHDEESDEHNEAYSDCLGGIAVDFDLRAVYYKPDNHRNEFKDKHAIYVFGIINEDLKERKDMIEEGFSFDSISDLKDKLPKAINKVLAWYKVDDKKMASGGQIKTIADLRAKNEEKGHHFFAKETMRFF